MKMIEYHRLSHVTSKRSYDSALFLSHTRSHPAEILSALFDIRGVFLRHRIWRFLPEDRLMPFKEHTARRHKIPVTKFKVTN